MGPCKLYAHTGRPIDTVTLETLIRATASARAVGTKSTLTMSTLAKVPQDTAPFTKTGGGYWFTERQRQAGPSKPFIATTAYRSEMLQGGETAARQLRSSEGVRSTLVGYEASRARASTGRRTQSLTSSRRPMTAYTASGEIVGYQSTYNAMMSPVAARVTPPVSPSVPEEPRWLTMPAAMAPGMFGAVPSSRVDFGFDGSDPASRAAPGERYQSRLATTSDLSEGTVRNTNNPPGYTGHVPSSRHHRLARAQADAVDERPPKDAQYRLDQYNRERVAGLTTYKPTTAKNIRLDSTRGPTMATTYGEATAQLAKLGGTPLILDRSNYINSRAGLMSFFNPGASETVSENGLFEAQSYFSRERH